MESHKIVSHYNNICCTVRLIRSFLVHQKSSPWYHAFWCPGDRASAAMVLTLFVYMNRDKNDNGLLSGRCQAIIWTSAGILLIGTNFNEILIEIHIFPFKKMHLKMLFAKWRLFHLVPNVLAKMLRCNSVQGSSVLSICVKPGVSGIYWTMNHLVPAGLFVYWTMTDLVPAGLLCL